MAAKWFRCPDGETIEIIKCLAPNGCRMGQRCATVPFLQLIGFDRQWAGVSPSSAGNGPRALYLKATESYVIDPNDRVWAAFGTSTHNKLAIHHYTRNVLSEEKLSDKDMAGIADVLETDDQELGKYIITDYKTWGSYKVAKALGISVDKQEETVLDQDGKPVILKSGPNKGQPKTVQKSIISQSPAKVDLKAENLQINRYRIFFERYGFPVSRMQVQALCRDGGTYIAKNRGITRNLYMIPIQRLLNADVLSFYKVLADEVNEAFKHRHARLCNNWESWDRRRCEGFCEVVDACKEMSRKANERWGLI